MPVAGDPLILPPPPSDGLTQGISGTNDPATLASAQPFEVRSVSTFDVPSQSWLVYIPGAPAIANSLSRGLLDLDSVVTIRAGLVPDGIEFDPIPLAPAATPAATVTPTPEPTPTSTATVEPTAEPTPEVTASPTASPTARPRSRLKRPRQARRSSRPR